MGWLIALGVLAFLGGIPLGAFVRYDADGFVLRIVVGFLRIPVLPRKKKGEKKAKSADASPKEAPAEEKAKSADASAAAGSGEKGGSIWDFYPLVRVGMRFLNRFRTKLRVDALVLKLTLGGDDPCDLAQNYARAWAALGNLVPALERFFRIRRRDFEVQCDFTSEETRIVMQARLTIPLWQLIQLGVVYGCLLIKEFLILKKKRKGGIAS